MDDPLKWLALNGDNISTLGLLVVFILALVKEWVVLGSTHRECIRDRDRFEGKVESLAADNEEKIARLELEIDNLRASRRRS